MTASVPFFQMAMAWSPRVMACDLVIQPTGNGRGRIAIDATAATALLIALGTDRRAEPDDTLPGDVAGLPAQSAGLLAMRGWVGDICQPEGQRLGTRAWLEARGKATEETRARLAGYTAESVEPIADYHGVDIQTGAAWLTDDTIQITAQESATSVATVVGS